jgi:hypothetical protein
MKTGVMVADWIKRVVDDERGRDAVRRRENEDAARKADYIRLTMRRVVEELRAAVTRDVEAFRDAFEGDPGRAIVVESTQPANGIVIRKPAPAAASLTVTAHPEAAAVTCHYRFIVTDGLPPRETTIDITFIGGGDDVLQFKQLNSGRPSQPWTPFLSFY